MPIARCDLQRLRMIADYRVVTIRQLAMIEARSRNAVHRSLNSLVSQELIEEHPRTASTSRGRREKLVSVASKGFVALCQANALPPENREQDITLAGLPHIEHQLLLNWVRIQWMHLDLACPSLRGRFVPHSSPTARYDAAVPDTAAGSVPTLIRLDDRRVFTPDAVATVTDIERHKTVLFFLEVDMGTEQWDAPRNARTTIMGKILNYQRTRRSEGYRLHAAAWQCSLHGFRVLFVTRTRDRLDMLCRRLCVVRPRDFIWLTDQTQLLERGIGARIWARGGSLDRPAESILGSRADASERCNEAARVISKSR